MTGDDSEFEARPGRVGDQGRGQGRKSQKLAAQVRRAGAKAGYTRLARGKGRGGGTGRSGRGRAAALGIRRHPNSRRVIAKVRTIRHKGLRFRAAPLARHIAYLERDGVSRDGRSASVFDARAEDADGEAFAERCKDDRHHFRIIVSPEDAGQMSDLRAFTRELMADVTRDLDTELDWVAIDHWNTDNPHIHILVRGIAGDDTDLVIDKEYIRSGVRGRAEERVTMELGRRTEREMQAALRREVDADYWTSLDERLQGIADNAAGVVDLRPGGADPDPELRRLLIGRAAKLERLGLAEAVDPAAWVIKPGLEQTLRDLSIRTDIIKTMHRAMSRGGRMADPGTFALHDGPPADPVIGRLVARGLHDELEGTAYAVIEGADGRTHHLRFEDLDMTGDSKPGSIVELRAWQDAKGETRLSLAARSDLSLAEQVSAPGATWLDRQLVAREPVATAGGFGREIRDALEARAEHLAGEGLAQRRGQGFAFARNLLGILRDRELVDAVDAIAERTGLEHRPSAPDENVAGVYRERVTLSSGRFAVIDDGVGFQLVPWRPALEHHLGQHITGAMTPGGGVDWALGRGRGLGV